MRNSRYNFLLVLLTSMVLASCTKDGENEISTLGKASAKINGEAWSGEVNVMNRGEKISILMESFKEVYGAVVPWETISLGFVRKKTDSVQGVFESDSLRSTAPWLVTKVYGSFSTNQADGDVLCDSYEVMDEDSVNNWVRIDKQKDNFKQVLGSFAMHLYRVETCETTKYPDTLLITDGKFYFEQ